MSALSPRPNLNTDKDYLAKVESLMSNTKDAGEIHFVYLSKLISIFCPQVDIYTLYKDEDGKEKIQKIVEGLFEKINDEKQGEMVENILHRLWDYLCEADELKESDLIFVFGGISRIAVEQAIELKNKGYAPKIMFSGKHASYVDGTEKTEAEQYRDLAVERGVRAEDIIIENNSVNTPENIVNSKKVLEKINFTPKSIIAVSLPYHMKRASLTMWAGFDWEPEIIRFPGKSAKYNRENYYKDIKGFSYIFYEYLKIYGAREMGHF